MRLTSIPSSGGGGGGGVEILLVTSCYRDWDKLRPDGHLQTSPRIFNTSSQLTKFNSAW